jgi:enoyl-[acyl-carrier protein] reductase II
MGNDTVILGRSFGQVRRVLKDPYTEKVLDLEKQGLSPVNYREMTSEVHHINGAMNGDVTNGFMNSGQVAGLIDDIPTVKELLDGMMKDAKKHMEDGLSRLSAPFMI